jgi:hypothetical protein
LENKLVFAIVGLLGFLECLFGVSSFLVGVALLGSGGTAGVGALVSMMGLMSIPIGVFLFLAGFGLLRRKRSGRRLNIALAVLTIAGVGVGIFALGAGIALFSVLFTAIGVLKILYLPPVKEAFR